MGKISPSLSSGVNSSNELQRAESDQPRHGHKAEANGANQPSARFNSILALFNSPLAIAPHAKLYVISNASRSSCPIFFPRSTRDPANCSCAIVASELMRKSLYSGADAASSASSWS